MTDWKAVARAQGMDLTDDQLARTLAPLEALETQFKKAVATLTSDIQPAVVFDPSPEHGR